ncbi:MAG: DEAD/DEAH box helicase family protein [Candidatus Nanoarchaeia archaeon]|nr:DEAD/DEAH box helicase family protein [Candidatus Nanoarchaeia archaeon]
MIKPLEFQEEAREKLTEKFLKLWDDNKRKLPLVFQSPTGSGKTFMVSSFIRGLNKLPQWDVDKTFIWVTFSDDIAMQSKDKFINYFENTLENNLLTVADINKGKLQKNEILFLNWQKIVSRAESTKRILRRPENEEERKETGYYFEDFIENTHKDNREIILIIDEAHTHVTERGAKPIIDMINPSVVLHVSATPDRNLIAEAAGYDSFIKIPHKRVVEEGLIKEKVIVQTEEDLNRYLKEIKKGSLEEAMIDLAIEKRGEIVKEYKKLKKKINPLILVQLPNDDSNSISLGEKTKEEIATEILHKKGVDEKKIARWFENHKKPDYLEEPDDEHEYLLFKQAAGTGWDCPRAHILVRFREIQSETFDLQTVGRILRMPEPHKKEDYVNSPTIRTGYLFTNYDRNKIHEKWKDVSPNKPATLPAKRKKGIKNIHLKSDFVSRLEYGDLADSAKFQMSFLKSMNKYFGINSDDLLKGKGSAKLSRKGINLKPEIKRKIIMNAEFKDFDNLNMEFDKEGEDMELEMSNNDIEKTFNYYIYRLLTEQTEDEAKISNIVRSHPTLKSAIRVWFKSVLTDNSNYMYKIFIEDIDKDSSSIFRPAITQALKDYKPILKEIINKRREIQESREANDFTILDEYWFSEDYLDIPAKLCVLDKFYLKNEEGKDNEEDFMKYIDSKEDKISWWFKNGDYGKEYYAIKYWNTKEEAWRLFFPDWIILFKDGKIGIFDTKKGDTALPQGRGHTKDKAKYLQMKMEKLGKNFVGGIAVKENNVWYYHEGKDYDYYPGRLNKDWKKFEDLMGKN